MPKDFSTNLIGNTSVAFPFAGDSCQVALAASSICDRIAFAPRLRRNRTAFLLTREKCSKVALQRLAGRFL
jgi:hypothetical protein